MVTDESPKILEDPHVVTRDFKCRKMPRILRQIPSGWIEFISRDDWVYLDITLINSENWEFREEIPSIEIFFSG